MKVCTYCAEQIQDAAIKCRYCGSAVLQSKPARRPLLEQINTIATGKMIATFIGALLVSFSPLLGLVVMVHNRVKKSQMEAWGDWLDENGLAFVLLALGVASVIILVGAFTWCQKPHAGDDDHKK